MIVCMWYSTWQTNQSCCGMYILLDRLKSLDVEVMKQLHHKVNIIPLIAKADTMTADECRDFKKTVSCLICLASRCWY